MVARDEPQSCIHGDGASIVLSPCSPVVACGSGHTLTIYARADLMNITLVVCELGHVS